MIEVKRLAELRAFLATHGDSPPDLIARAYQLNRATSRNTLENHKEQRILSALLKKRR